MECSSPLLILYGSQTGNAEDVAINVWQDGHRRSVPVLLYEMDDFSLDRFGGSERRAVVVCICSTTGQGEMPENMKQFWRRLLKSSLPCDYLSNWHIAVLGLGDSSYQNFNFAAKKLFRRLTQLGTRPILRLALADEQHEFGTNTVVEEWKRLLWRVLEDGNYFKIRRSLLGGVLPPKYEVRWLSNTASETDEVQEIIPHGEGDMKATIVANRRLTPPDHFQDVRRISFQADKTVKLRYLPGDAIRIYPSNLQETIDIALNALDATNLDAPFTLIGRYPDVKPPPMALAQPPYTFRKLLQRAFDLQVVPRPSFFGLLAEFAVNKLERDRLKELASVEGLDDLFDYCNRPKRTVIETLRDFRDTAKRVPADYWFELFSWIKPRYFSIASCAEKSGNIIDLVLAIVNYRTMMATPRQGLCSTWLSRLPVGAEVWFSIKRGSFLLPADNVPCLLVGTGTGIAPLKSFLSWRSCRSVPNNYLVFGCRNKTKDFYFREEFEKLSDCGLVHLFMAFSRDQPQKQYVQHKILEQKYLIFQLLTKMKAVVWLCGNATDMPDCVLQAFKDILVSEGHMSPDQASSVIKQMQHDKLIQIETWS